MFYYYFYLALSSEDESESKIQPEDYSGQLVPNSSSADSDDDSSDSDFAENDSVHLVSVDEVSGEEFENSGIEEREFQHVLVKPHYKVPDTSIIDDNSLEDDHLFKVKFTSLHYCFQAKMIFIF